MEVANKHGTPQSILPPQVAISVMSELMLQAAVLIQGGRLSSARFIFERIREIARGENIVIYGENEFKSNLEKLTKALR